MVLGVIGVAAWLWLRRGDGASPQAASQLRRVRLGNNDQVERLIEGEMIRGQGAEHWGVTDTGKMMEQLGAR